MLKQILAKIIEIYLRFQLMLTDNKKFDKSPPFSHMLQVTNLQRSLHRSLEEENYLNAMLFAARK